MTKIVLASRSQARGALLAGAGISFTAVPSAIDERVVEAPLLARGASPADIASALAEAKAIDVSRREPDAFVVGADQTLGSGGRLGTKPASINEAREQLAGLSGRMHQLHSAVAVARGSRVVWHHRDSAALTMRRLDAATIDAYLAAAGDAALSSVGAYQIEGPGIRLFEAIDGDYFTILGLPLLPLLLYLRGEGATQW